MRISADKINWRVALGELSLIVIGILMALTIDSYAGRRADDAQAAVYIKDLKTELQADVEYFEASYSRLGHLIDSASSLLRLLEADGAVNSEVSNEDFNDPGILLLGSVAGEGVTQQPAIWEEMQMTGALRLLTDTDVRTAIVGHYLRRAGEIRIIEENFVPAVRDLRALAWDVMPVESFPRYFRSRQSGERRTTGVPKTKVMTMLQSRNDTKYLLKRVIATASVARVKLASLSDSTANLITELGEPQLQ